jgi:hypothetical protein
MREGKLGLTTHYFPRLTEEVEEVTDRFDCARVARQCEEAGAAWFMLTLHHQPWLMQAPNEVLDRITGTTDYTAGRDLAADLHEALSSRGIRMMLYLNLRIDPDGGCLPPIKRALGPCPPETETVEQVAEVYRVFAERYGERVSGWWGSGGTQFETEELCAWARRVVKGGGVMSFDVGTRGVTKAGREDPDPVQEGPVGAIDPRQVEQIRAVSEAITK